MMIEAAANKIDAFIREYEEEGELIGITKTKDFI